MGEKNKFSSPGAYAGNRRGRKAAGIIGGICGTGAAIIVLIGLLMHPTSFVTVINYDTKAKEAQALRLKTGMGSEGKEITNDETGKASVAYESLKRAKPTYAKTVLKKYQEYRDNDKLNSAQIIPSGNEKDDQLGIIYNVYLENSGESALNYQFSINLTDYKKGNQGYPASSLYSFLRIVICEADVSHPEEEKHHWFAAASSTLNEERDNREAIATYTTEYETAPKKSEETSESGETPESSETPESGETPESSETPESGETPESSETKGEMVRIRKAAYADKNTIDGKDKKSEEDWIWYATPFSDSLDSQQMCVVPNLNIQPKATTRFSVIVYLEGDDPDCKGQPPQNEYFSLSAEIALL